MYQFKNWKLICEEKDREITRMKEELERVKKMPIQEKRFEYYGFPCVILFMQMGYRCGYVGVPADHKYYGENYDDIPIDCHCGLTYSDDRLHGQEDKHTWWIGFDCGHACDGYDVEKMKEYFKENEEVMCQLKYMESYFKTMNEMSVIRTLEYCEEECKKIVEQLLEV